VTRPCCRPQLFWRTCRSQTSDEVFGTRSFAIHLASKDGYEDAFLPNGSPIGTAEEALDCACGLYLNDPTAWHPQ
jgi:hypothetical protein